MFMRKTLPILLTIFITLLFSSFIFSQNIKDTYYILFDNTKSETAANADWVIDDNQPDPEPSNPSSESDWTGGISTWGYLLYSNGNYVVKTLTSSYGITYNDSSNPYDLSNFDVFVLCEPNNPLSQSEKEAIIQFVYNGGGLFLIADHNGSDRDNDGWDSPHVLNDLFDNNGYASNIFGVKYELNSISGDYSNIDSNPDSDGSQLLNGDFGNVSTISYHGGASMTIDTSANSNAKGLIWENGISQDSTNSIVAAYSKYGNGRIFLLGDSSMADDGTGHTGDNLQDGWNENSDGILILNATKWLAEASGSGGDLPPSVSNITQTPTFPTSSDSTTISADVSDDVGVSTVKLYYSVDGSNYTGIDMVQTKGATYQGTIPAQSDGSRVEYFIQATDTGGNTTTSDTKGYFSGTTQISKIKVNDENGTNEYIGYYVRIEGYITVATGTFNSSSNDIYVEDESAGINIWQRNQQNPSVSVGDKVKVEGVINQYKGKTEIEITNSPCNMQVLSTSNTVYPTVITCKEINETFEGMLVEIRDVKITDGSFPSANSNAWNIKIEDRFGNEGMMAVDKDTNIDGTPTPTGTFNLIGVVYQYDSDSPYNSGYKILPRSTDDIEENPPYIPNVTINEFCVKPENTCDTNGDGVISQTEDQFIEIVNMEKSDVDISGWNIYLGDTLIYTFPSNTTLSAKSSAVIFGGGTPQGDFGDALVLVSSGLNLDYENDIILKDDSGNFINHLLYKVDTSYSGSYTRDPDVEGRIYKHTSTAFGTCSSPGLRTNGNDFVSKGDLNYDGVITLNDLMILANYITGNIDENSPLFVSTTESADVDGNGNVNVEDEILLANILAGN